MPVPNRVRCFGACLASLLIGTSTLAPGAARAAEQLQLRLDGLEIPMSLTQLEAWSRGQQDLPRGTDLGVWLSLLTPQNRQDLRRMLRAPLLREAGFGRQLLDSWAGGQMLAELGQLLTTPDGRSTTLALQTTLRRLLQEHREVTALELLRGLPVPRLSLQLDGLIGMADQWRLQLRLQRRGLRRLEGLALPQRRVRPLATAFLGRARPRRLELAVAHRSEPLPLEIWSPPPADRPADRRPLPWLLLMPGLGGNADQMGWLAAALAQRGWWVVVLQHPGSDGPALKASLEGLRPPPGAESVAVRLADAQAVLQAQRQRGLGVEGEGVVLGGHSLGGLTALIAAGLTPEPGLAQRCARAMDRLPIANPSRLLQCQLPTTEQPRPQVAPADLRGVMVFNGFGSLLWPGRGVRPLGVPLLLLAGSLDLVTPPLSEQLALFLPAVDRRSRLVLVDGASHFSPVRVSAREEALFRVDDALVGVDPETVQAVLLEVSSEFLQTLQQPPLSIPPQQRIQQGVKAYVLDPPTARQWQSQLRR
ncbi:MAG: alpha/beta hydrolase [Cyanobacteriota bacterium]